jgi:hypothetical protein
MLEISSVGAKVAYCVAATAGVMPTTGYTEIPDIKEAPEIEMTTETLDCSNLSDEITRYIAGRSDPGGEKAFSANNTSAFRTAWETFVTAAKTAAAAGKETYIAYIPPEGDDDAFFWIGQPQPLGHGGFQDNSVLTLAPKVVCAGVIGYEAKPTLDVTPETYLVTFGVSDSLDARIPGAKVSVDGKALITDANGFAKTYLADGNHAYIVSATGYEDASGSVSVSAAAAFEEVTMTDEA